MGCASASCYSTSPYTTTVTYTTTEDGSAKVITTTAMTTPATPTGSATSAAGGGAVAKYFPSTATKALATSTSSSSGGGNGGLSKAAIGGIIAGVVVLLIAVVTAAYLIIKRLKKTEKVVQSVRETTSGTRTRRTTDKKSEVSQVRVRPTPSEVDQMDYDPLMMGNTSLGSPRHQVISNNLNGRARGDSDAESQGRSLWSGPSAGLRWNTPSVDSDGGGRDDREYFELPPRTTTPGQHHMRSISDGRPQMPMRASMESSSQYSYHNYAYGHGRHWSNASELSAGSDENSNNNNNGGGGGSGTTPMLGAMGSPTPPQELGVEGEFRPELPGSDTETESNHGGSRKPRAPPRRRSTGVVSPMSTTTATMATISRPPPSSNGAASRRRGNSMISPVEEEKHSDGSGNGGHNRGLGSIDESVSTVTGGATDSLHGHYGRSIAGPLVNDVPGLDMAGAPMGLGLSLMGGLSDDDDGDSEKKSSEGKSN